MGIELNEAAASRSYTWNRKVKPLLREVLPYLCVVVLGLNALNVLTPKTVTVVKNTFFQRNPDGTITVVGDTEHPVFKEWCEATVKGMAESFAQYPRDDEKVFSARVDAFYDFFVEEARVDFSKQSESVLKRIPKEATRIESSLINTVYDRKRDMWASTYVANVIVEDEAGRQFLRKFSLGAECQPVIPSKEYKHAGQITKLKVTTQDPQ